MSTQEPAGRSYVQKKIELLSDWRPWLGALVISLIATLFMVFAFGGSQPVTWAEFFSRPRIAGMGLFLVGFTGGMYFRDIEARGDRARDKKLSELPGKLGEDFFNTLVTNNFEYLDMYYRQTRKQANRSFWLAAAAGVAGFGLVCFGVVTLGGSEANAIQYLTAISGIISEFVAAVFFYLYNQTAQSMTAYHQKLVVTQNVALALKVAEGMSDGEKAAAQKAIVEALIKDVNALLAGPALPAKLVEK